MSSNKKIYNQKYRINLLVNVKVLMRKLTFKGEVYKVIFRFNLVGGINLEPIETYSLRLEP